MKRNGITQAPVTSRAFRNGFVAALNAGHTRREAIEAGKVKLARAERYITKQRERGSK